MMEIESDHKQVRNIQEEEKFATDLDTYFTLLKCAVGSGVLALPFSFLISGYLGGIFLLVMVAIFNFYAWRRLVQVLSADDPYNRQTINDYIVKVFGEKSVISYVSQIATIVLMLGSIPSYIIFMNAAIQSLFSSMIPVYIFAGVNFILLMYFSFKENLYNLQFITIVSTFMAAIVISFVFFYCSATSAHESPRSNLQALNIGQFPIAYGIILFAYDINGIITSIRGEMQQPQRFMVVLGKSMFTEMVIYILIGGVGYMAFGDQTEDMITLNIDEDINNHGFLIFYQLLVLCYGITLIATSFLNLFPLLSSCNFLIEGACGSDTSSFSIRLSLRLILNLFFVSIPLVYSQFASILSIIGCICSVTLGFILPIYLYHHKFQEKIALSTKITNILVLLMGIIGGILGLLLNINPNLFN